MTVSRWSLVFFRGEFTATVFHDRPLTNGDRRLTFLNDSSQRPTGRAQRSDSVLLNIGLRQKLDVPKRYRYRFVISYKQEYNRLRFRQIP